MRTLFGIWVIAAAGWMVAVGYACVRTWPHLSLDLSHIDPSTRAAFDSAVFWHVASHGVFAVAVSLVVFGVGLGVMRYGARRRDK